MIRPRILIVAEDASLRATLARWVMGAGYAAELAESPKRAREVVASEEIAVAVLALDRFGAAGADMARELAHAVGQLILVGEPAVQIGEECAPISASGYIFKPLREEDVLAQVRAALRAEPDAEEAGSEILRFEGYTLDTIGRACFDAQGRKCC